MDSTNNDEDLSPELTEKLIHFQEITRIDDLDRCKAILRQFSWDVGNAVQSTMLEDSATAQVPVHQPQGLRRRIPPPPPVTQALPRSSINLYRAQNTTNQPTGFVGWSYFILALPFRFTFSSLLSIFRFFVRIFLPDPRSRITDPRGDVISFIEEFQDKYGNNHPTFFRGSYAEAQSESRRVMKFLLVYLHSSSHSDTDAFCANTLCHEDIIPLINHNSVFWACSVSKPEGYRVSRALRENTYPFLGVICQLEGRMTVIGRLEGPLSRQELMQQLGAIIQKYEPTLIALRADKAERDFTQLLRNEQDAAYQASLELDRQKEEKRKELEEFETKKMNKEKLKEQEKINAENLHKCRKEECLKSLSDEPDSSHPDILRLVVKLPDGTRLKRSFLKTDSVEILHNFVFSHENSPKKIALMHNFPPKPVTGCNTNNIFSVKDALQTKKKEVLLESGEETVTQNEPFVTLVDAGLKNFDVLFVHSIEDDDSDDSDS